VIRAAAVVLLTLAAAAPVSPVTALAGRYSYHDVDPFTRQPLDSVAEIVPVDATHAYVNFNLQFANGFSCGLSGVAHARGATLIYRDPRMGDRGGHCVLTIRRDGSEFSYDDGDNSCKGMCGMNAEFTGTLPWRSKRPITYMATLKRSAEYKAAIAEWTSGKVD
jgi:hypothetical protein